ncbi:unnamed protein product [Closterium sp. NIES-54]
MVDPVANAEVAHTLEARLADARKSHEDGEYGSVPWAIAELGIWAQWVTDHPSRPVSPQLVRNEGGVDDEVDGGAQVSGNNGTKQGGVIKVDGGVDRSWARVRRSTAAAGSLRADVDGRRRSPLRSGGGLSATTHVTASRIAPAYRYFKFSPDRITVAPLQGRRDLITYRESIEPLLEVAGLKGFADGTVPTLPVDDVELRREYCVAHLLTFMVFSRCCSPVVQLTLRSCRERLDAGHQAWHFILSTYQMKDDLYIGQLEEKMTQIRMGKQESATDYSNRARRILAEMRMAGAEYSTASYITHVLKGLPRSYNLMKRMTMVPGTLEPTVSLAPEAGEDFPAVAAAVLLDSGCSHHLMGTKAVFIDMAPSDDVKHMHRFNEALQLVQGRGIVPLQGEARKRVLILDVLYVLDVKANLLSTGQLKESGVQLKGDGNEMLLVAATGEALAVVHIDLCMPFRVAAKDGSLYFVLLKDRHTRFVWVMPVAKKSDVLREFQKWLVLQERQAKNSVLMLWSDRGGEFLGKEFTDFVDGKGIIHDLTCPYTPQQNGMAEREMRTAVKSFMIPEQQRGGKLVPKARWGLHLGVSLESKGWEAHPPTDTSTTTVPLLAEVDEPADEDVVEDLPRFLVLAPPSPVADRPALTSVLATGDEGSLEASPMAPASDIAGGRQGAKLVDQDGNPSTTGKQQTRELVEQEAAAGLFDDESAEEGEQSAGEESTVSDMVEVPIMKPELRRTGRAGRLPKRLSFHACLPPAAFTTVYDEVDDDLLYNDAEEDQELPELNPDVHADPEHRWDIATMMVKEAMASWKREAVKAAMEEEIRSLIGMGTWELVERPCGVNIMKNRWVLTTKYRIDNTIEREKARLVVKGFTQVCGANYDETYSSVSSYVMLRAFLNIVAILDLNMMQLGMKNTFLQSKLDRVLYMALDGVLLGAGWKKSQVDEVLYFKAGNNGVTCWVLVYVDDLLAASSSPAMLNELKEWLEAAFKLREISPVVKYLGLEIVHDRPARKLWLHQQVYTDKLRRRFIDEEQGGRVPKTPVLVDAYAELTFNDKEA